MWNKIRPLHLRSKYFTAKLFHLAKPNFTCRRRISLKKDLVGRQGLFSGGGDGSRTRVQKSIPKTFSECRCLFVFPNRSVKHQTGRFGSPLNRDTLQGSWVFTFSANRHPHRTAELTCLDGCLIRQQVQLYYCYLIYNLRLLERFRTATRLSWFKIPVETFTPPYLK